MTLNRTYKRLSYNLAILLAVFMNTNLFGQWEGGDDPGPPPPDGLGNQASPIDMYTVWLLGAAVLLVIYIVRKQQKKIV